MTNCICGYLQVAEIEGDESLEECARRETLEETGLSVEIGDIVYVRDFLEPGYHHCRDILSGDFLLRQRYNRNEP